MNIQLRPIQGNDADQLLALSTQYMEGLYPAESNHLVDYDELYAENAVFLGAYVDAEVVGCVAVIYYQDDGEYGEIKRLFVLPEYRKLKLGRKLMAAIEAKAKAAGQQIMRLETGIYQPESIHLYKRLGYMERGPYGKYQADPLSIFMEKHLLS